MIRDIIQYPTPTSVEFAVDVRAFNENIVTLIEDLKDTIEANGLEGLSAFQIGSYYNVIVIKQEDGNYLELINPRILSTSGKQTSQETTAYYPGVSAQVQRYDQISLIYQKRDGENSSYKTEGKESALIQRKIDYTFGATFIQKLTPQERERFEASLASGSDVGFSDYCPTTFHRDKILKVINISMVVMLLALLASFFIDEKESLQKVWEYQLYASYTLVGLNLFYLFYAQYEGKKYTSCSSCQLGNIIGTVTISFIKLLLIMLLSYTFINPS